MCDGANAWLMIGLRKLFSFISPLFYSLIPGKNAICSLIIHQLFLHYSDKNYIISMTTIIL